MKGLILIFGCLLISISANCQSEKWKQKNARLNFSISPQFEFVKIGGNYNPTAGISGSIVFNSTYYFGGYFTKKMLRNYNTYPAYPASDLDVNYQHVGMEFLYAMPLGLYRTKGGHYVHPKLRIVFGGRIGAGTFWMDDINKQKVSTRDYFYFVQPQAGITYPLNDFITFHGGLCFTSSLSVDKLNAYLKTKDFTGPGIYVSAKFTLFR